MTTLKELKELDAKATSAPWHGFFATFSIERMVAFSHVSNDECASIVATKNDYELITATRNALPDLIRVIELAEELINQGNFTYLSAEYVFCVRPKNVKELEEKIKGLMG